jgi:elongation factor G
MASTSTADRSAAAGATAEPAAVLPTSRLRTVAFIGHAGSGKTTLAEALLVRSGAIPRGGRVADGTSVLDVEPESVKRRHSLSMTAAPFVWKGHRITVLDTPGDPDFDGEVETALRLADLAVVVVNAVDGVQVRTEALWRRCARLGLPRMIFVNGLDRERADFDRVVEDLVTRFGAGVAPIELPIGTEAGLRGVADLLTDEAITDDGTGASARGPLPDDMVDREHAVHDALVEGLVVADDDLLERFLGGDVPAPGELLAVLAHGVTSARLFPVLCGSAATGVGLDRLADVVVELAPSPVAARPARAHAPAGDVEVPADPDAAPLAFVAKTIADPFVGQLSVLEVLSGTIRPDDRLVNVRTGSEERLHALFRLRGKEQIPVTAAVAGDIVAVAKVAGLRTGDTLAPKGTPVRLDPVPTAPPAYRVAVVARTQADDDKLSTALARLCDTDPTLSVHRDDETHQTLLAGTGDTHLAVAIERLARSFGVNVDIEPVRIAYRETISGTAEVEGKVKKQSGGHGQFAVVQLRVSPRQRGEGLVFVDSVVGGAVPRSFIPAVERGVVEAAAAGGLHGFPVVDICVELCDGKAHAVDSSEMAFKTAAALGLREALGAAGVTVLEPVSRVEVTVPTEVQGDVLSDLTGRRGRVVGTTPADDGDQVITALVPAAELARYAIDLRSLTGGRGRHVATHDHHEPLPANLVAAAAAAARPNGRGTGG